MSIIKFILSQFTKIYIILYIVGFFFIFNFIDYNIPYILIFIFFFFEKFSISNQRNHKCNVFLN